jgi:hypothetical protein
MPLIFRKVKMKMNLTYYTAETVLIMQEITEVQTKKKRLEK